MQVFLTGDRRTGKSSIVEKFLILSGLKAGGFRTCWRPSDTGGEDLLLLPYSIEPKQSGEANRVAHRCGQTLETFPGPFDQLGPSLLADDTRRRIVVMDELGFIESRSTIFQAAVLRCLEGQTPVLGVIRARTTPFLDLVRSHPGLVLLTVTADNRDAVLNELLELFKETII